MVTTQLAVPGLPMAKKSNYTTVKVRTDLVERARVIVAIRKIQLSDFLSDGLQALVDREYPKAIKEAASQEKTKKNGAAE
jgi:hypothetical protein